MILRTPSIIFIRPVVRVSLANWLLSTILLALLTTRPALAQDATWLPIGPVGDRVCESTAVAVVPGADGGIYTAGLGCGVFYSADDGATWVNRGAGLPAGGVTALAVAPSQPTRLYAGANRTVYRSNDSGRSWRKLADVLDDFTAVDMPLIIVHPADPDVLYVMTFITIYPTVSDDLHIREGNDFWNRITRLYRSLDGGESWTQVGTSAMNDVVFDPDNPRRMYATNHGTILRSDDSWETWDELPAVTPRRYMVERIYMPSSSVIYASMASGHGIYRSADSGASWNSINEGLPDTFITALSGDPADPMVLYAAGHGGDIFRYDHGAASWTRLAAQESTPFSSVTWLLPDRAMASPRLLTATPQGLFQSQDGVQWRLLSQEVRDQRMNVHDLTVTAGPQGRVWIAGGPNGVFSRPTQPEEGVSPPWTTHASGLEGQRVLSLAVDPQNPDILYAGTETNLFKSEDRGQSWRESDTGLEPPPLPGARETAKPTGLSVTALAVDPTDGDRVYAGTSQSLFSSTDGGENWVANTDFTDVLDSPIHPAIRQIVIAPSDPNTLYAVMQLDEQERCVFKSVDGGENWILPTIDGFAIPTPAQLAVTPRDAEMLYGVSDEGIHVGGVWKSEDGGHIWHLIGPGIAGFIGSHMAITETDSPVIAVAGVQGYDPGEPRSPIVYLSKDDGVHWIPLDSGLGNGSVTSIAFDPARPTHLYAGTEETGVMEIDFTWQETFLPAVFAR